MLPATFRERIVTFRVKCGISGEFDISGLYKDDRYLLRDGTLLESQGKSLTYESRNRSLSIINISLSIIFSQ